MSTSADHDSSEVAGSRSGNVSPIPFDGCTLDCDTGVSKNGELVNTDYFYISCESVIARRKKQCYTFVGVIRSELVESEAMITAVRSDVVARCVCVLL